MNAPVPGWVETTTTYDVPIPSNDGLSIIGSETISVPAWKDPDSGEIFFGDEAITLIEQTKARLMGLLSPEEIKDLRARLGLTQKRISELLQIGEKSWTRWETGRERPSRATNLILRALKDGKIDIPYLTNKRPTSPLPSKLWTIPSIRHLAQDTIRYSTNNALTSSRQCHDNYSGTLAA